MSPLRQSIILLVAILIAVSIQSALSQANAKKSAKKPPSDPNDNRGNTPFFLQDPHDEMCLGPKGFTACNEAALWILTRRPGKKTYSLVSLLNPSPYGTCLESKSKFLGIFGSDSVGMGLCSQPGAQAWDFEFLDSKHVKLCTKGKCIVRGKKTYKNSVSILTEKKGQYLPLKYHPTAVHEAGFFLKSADGMCFDGQKFRSCSSVPAKQLLWGIGIKYIWGKANRYFFDFADKNKCLVSKGGKVSKDDCNKAGALKWGLQDGLLSQNSGKSCLARLPDNSAVMARCSSAYEYITVDIPQTYTAEDLAAMMKNPEKLSAEERVALQQMLKQQQQSGAAAGGVKR